MFGCLGACLHQQDDGGLGLKDLKLQNQCLLLKFVDKFLTDAYAPWKDWLLHNDSIFSDNPSTSTSYLWNIIKDELSTYRPLTYVEVKDGSSTSFWHDHWLLSGPIASTHPALFSHTLRPNIYVQQVISHDFEMHLRPRLTRAAAAELESLMIVLQDTQLQEGQDIRRMTATRNRSKPGMLTLHWPPLPACKTFMGDGFGGTKVPNKVKVFAWLFFKDRLSTKSNLRHKHIMDDEICQRCNYPVEDRHHVFFTCPLSSEIWGCTGLASVLTMNTMDIWASPVVPGMDPEVWPSILLAILWRI